MGAGTRFVVVGGGVSGVVCCQTLAAAIQEAQTESGAARGAEARGGHVTLVAAAGLLKGVANVVRLTRHLDSFDSVEHAFDDVAGPHTEVLEGEAVSVDTEGKVLTLRDGRTVPFDKLCICTGARPKIVSDHARVLALRDTASVQELRDKLKSCRRVLVTGNGGIAMELVHEITNCELVWVVREPHMGNAFFDEDAADFLAPALASRLASAPVDPVAPPSNPCHRPVPEAGSLHCDDSAAEQATASTNRPHTLPGSSLGPQWMHGSLGLEYKPAQVRRVFCLSCPSLSLPLRPAGSGAAARHAVTFLHGGGGMRRTIISVVTKGGYQRWLLRVIVRESSDNHCEIIIIVTINLYVKEIGWRAAAPGLRYGRTVELDSCL